MRTVLRFAARVIGVLFMAAAFLQWLTFDYPDINPFGGVTIFTPGAISQVLNWALVCVLATVGWGFFTYGRFRLKEPESTSAKNRKKSEKIGTHPNLKTSEVW